MDEPKKFTFLSVGQANEEIERLTKLANDQSAALDEAKNKVKTLESEQKLVVASPELSQLQADLATAKQTIGTLEASIKAKDQEIANLKAEVTKAQESASTLAAKQAHEITAAQGQPPVDIKPAEQPATAKPAATTLTGLAKAIAAHKAGYDTK